MMPIIEVGRFCLGLMQLAKTTAFMILMLFWANFSVSAYRKLKNMMVEVMKDTGMAQEDYADTIYSLAYIKQFTYARYIDLWRRARLHETAPDTTVLTTKGKPLSLLAAMKQGRPLVLNFGSCS